MMRIKTKSNCIRVSILPWSSRYAYHRGVNEAVLAVARGIGAGFGLLGTFVYPWLYHRKGATWTGGVSIWLQLAMLSLCVVSTFFGMGDEGDCSADPAGDGECMRTRCVVLSVHSPRLIRDIRWILLLPEYGLCP